MTKARANSIQQARKQCAFTLVELLVVIGIIALLISILLPSLARARSQARMTKCLAHMRGIAQASMGFANDHHDRLQLASDEIGVREADPLRNIYAYDENYELLAWPVALAQWAGISYAFNGVDIPGDPASDERRYGWGIRETTFSDAYLRRKELPQQLGLLLCPADRVRLSSPFYPRNKSADNNGLKIGGANWENDESAELNTAYWGALSYGINEDIVGAEVEESDGYPACWRAARVGDEWIGCRGEFAYPPSTPCGRSRHIGKRLRGVLEPVFAPSNVGLIIEAGPDNLQEAMAAGPEDLANLIISAQAEGPYLADSQQRFCTRMPSRRHLDGRLSILFADMHGEAVVPVDFVTEDCDDDGVDDKLPAKYAQTNVRISPYPVHDTGP